MNSAIAKQTLKEAMSMIDDVSRNQPDLVVSTLLNFLLEDFAWLEQYVDPADLYRMVEFTEYTS